MSVRYESTRGRTASLEDFRGRPTVLFYEHRGTEQDNAPLKFALRDRSEAEGWNLDILGFACLEGYPRVARPVIRPALRAIAESFGWELWMDFDGALLEAPFAFDRSRANVAVLDAEGRIRFQAAGRLDDRAQREVVGLVASLVSPSNGLLASAPAA